MKKKLKKIVAKISGFFSSASFRQSEAETDSVKRITKTEEYERCVICGALTCIPVSMPVDLRENYESGCGQICAECARKQHKTTKCANILTSEQIMLAVEQSRKGNSQ